MTKQLLQQETNLSSAKTIQVQIILWAIIKALIINIKLRWEISMLKTLVLLHIFAQTIVFQDIFMYRKLKRTVFIWNRICSIIINVFTVTLKKKCIHVCYTMLYFFHKKKSPNFWTVVYNTALSHNKNNLQLYQQKCLYWCIPDLH